MSEILEGVDDVAFCRLTSHDVVRHKLVGRIVEAVAGEPLAAFMQRRLFAPAGMQRSSFAPPFIMTPTS